MVMMMPRLLGRGCDAVAETTDDLLDLLTRTGPIDPQTQRLGGGRDGDVRTPGTLVSAVSILRAQLPQSMPSTR